MAAEIQISRENNIELLKALAVVAMIFCHPVIRLGIHHAGYEKEFAFFFGDVILGDFLGVAHAFMYAMGVGLVYTRKNAPGDLMHRGLRLYLLGYALNFCRYGVYALAEGIISGVFEPETLEALFGPDICAQQDTIPSAVLWSAGSETRGISSKPCVTGTRSCWTKPGG